MIGRRGGTVVADDVLKRLEPLLLKNRVVVSKNADRMLAGRAASGIFRVFKDGSATIFLRSDRTRYELIHELKHYGHFMTIGPDSFRSLCVVKVIDVKFADSDQLIRGFGGNHHQLA